MSSSGVVMSGGRQLPRVQLVPEYVGTSGLEICDLMAEVGQPLDPWQEHVIINSMGERVSDQKWAAFEVGVDVPRQNGKGGIIEGRTLGGLYLLGERLIIHSAHQFDTSLEAFQRLVNLIEGSDWLSRRVKKISRSHGEEGITLTYGQRVRFRTRTKGGGRGFTCDCLFLDEAMILPSASHGALMPTLSARPNPQIWYLGSAVDQDVHEHGLVFSRVRARGHEGKDDSLAWFEWSVPGELHEISDQVATDPEMWALANPALGIRISHEHIEREQHSLAGRTFAVERLGVGDWPDPSDSSDHVIDPETWRLLTDVTSQIAGPVSAAFDITPDRERAAIAVAGRRTDGRMHIEVIEHRAGTGWIAEFLEGFNQRNRPERIIVDRAGPAASLVPDLQRRGLPVTVLDAREYANACGELFDAAKQDQLRHLGTTELASALRGATTRTLGDAWAWSRRSSLVDISPLVAGTLAHYGAQNGEEDVPFVFEVLTP